MSLLRRVSALEVASPLRVNVESSTRDLARFLARYRPAALREELALSEGEYDELSAEIRNHVPDWNRKEAN